MLEEVGRRVGKMGMESERDPLRDGHHMCERLLGAITHRDLPFYACAYVCDFCMCDGGCSPERHGGTRFSLFVYPSVQAQAVRIIVIFKG